MEATTTGFLLNFEPSTRNSSQPFRRWESSNSCVAIIEPKRQFRRLATVATPQAPVTVSERRVLSGWRRLCPTACGKLCCTLEQQPESSLPEHSAESLAKPDVYSNPRYFTRPHRVSRRQRILERNQNNLARHRGRRALQAIFCGRVIAETSDYVFTDGRYYFPPNSVHDEYLIETEETRMMNPIGRARMMDVRVGNVRIRRAAWRFFETRRSDGGVWTTLQNYTAFWKSVRLRFAPRAEDCS
jgi:uncharacterized protein (DUF427 family)